MQHIEHDTSGTSGVHLLLRRHAAYCGMLQRKRRDIRAHGTALHGAATERGRCERGFIDSYQPHMCMRVHVRGR